MDTDAAFTLIELFLSRSLGIYRIIYWIETEIYVSVEYLKK